ncbi:MAG: hypothetical protein AAFW81_04095 [Pseudomonadota bacterium]
MEIATAVEKHAPRETGLQRLARHIRDFFAAFARVLLLAGALSLILLAALLTLDLPLRLFDPLFMGADSLRPSNWLTQGGAIMAAAPFAAILIARRFGGEEANRAVTAAWALTAFAVFAELSYLAPVLEEGDLPSARFMVAFVATAMAAQYMAVNVYDVARGGGDWWRAPLFASIGAFATYGILYFPWVYIGKGVPWANWMVTDFGIHMIMTGAFFPVYWSLRKRLRPRGGYGGI